MSENYSKEMYDIVTRVDRLNNVIFNSSIFSSNETSNLKMESNKRVVDHIDSLKTNLDIALTMTNNIDNKSSRDSRIFQSVLAKQVETALGEKTDFMDRDVDKQVTIYESFVNEYFSRMFGVQGYRRIFTGDYTGFMLDFKNYGATDDEIVNFNRAITTSVDTGEFNNNDFNMVKNLCDKVEKGRKLFEESSKVIDDEPIEFNIKSKKTL